MLAAFALVSALLVQLASCAVLPRTVVAPGTELRILPLGDSITWGYTSTDGNGYRLKLQQDLDGSNVNFVGTQQSGNMSDPDNEGHNGATINEIAGFAPPALAMNPNVVLLHAGTNDLVGNPHNEDPTQAPARLSTLISGVLQALPDTALLVAKIINTADSAAEARVQAYNDQVPSVVQSFVDQGYKVSVIDMTSILATDLIDGVHPNEAAYQRMGDIWFQGIHDAADAGLISAPPA